MCIRAIDIFGWKSEVVIDLSVSDPWPEAIQNVQTGERSILTAEDTLKFYEPKEHHIRRRVVLRPPAGIAE